MQAFAFLDLEHPPVAWAVMRGLLVSVKDVSPIESKGFVSFMLAGMIENENNRRMFNEFVIEWIRATNFPKNVSRLQGMYFFRTRAEAEARIGDERWPSYFRYENLLEVELHLLEPPTVVDANWITFAPRERDGRIRKGDLNWITRYWNGEPYNDAPVWELICNGTAVVPDTDVRRRCFARVKEVFPHAHIPVLMARLAGEAGSRGGLITPFLLREDEEFIRLGYVWSNAEFSDPEVIAKIAEHPDSGYLGRLMFENETWASPDFRRWGRLIRLGTQPVWDEVVPRFESMHHARVDCHRATSRRYR